MAKGLKNGKFSLISPRPPTYGEWRAYTPSPEIKQHYEKVLQAMKDGELKPGILGLYTSLGRKELSMDERIYLMSIFFEHANWISDLKILFFCIPAIISRRGAY
jgi:lipopolysaccharide/colanic/teichoic acid biosynthesis glycosyltransferase